MRRKVFTAELIAAKPFFKALSPGPNSVLLGPGAKIFKRFTQGVLIVKNLNHLNDGVTVTELLGKHTGNKVIHKVLKPAQQQVTAAHLLIPNINVDPKRKNGLGGHSWYIKPGRYQMVIIFHDANRAGPHIDVHIGRLSIIYRVKPDLYSKLKFNSAGYLTADSKKAILNHVRWEINNGSRVPQNLDHSLANARSEWVLGDRTGTQYGDGRTRQIVDITEVDIYKAYEDGPIEFYAPHLNAHRSMYLYRLYPGDGKRAPILIWGNKTHRPPSFEDRLHLKLVDPEILNGDLTEIPATKINFTTSTAKYDGSSAYVVISPKGTTVWSPRKSVKTSEQIEYTHMLANLSATHHGETVVAMGEVLFKKKTHGPWQRTKYLSASEGSGLLNSNQLLPPNIVPEIRLYRVDKIGRRNFGDLDFWSNRALQEEVASLNPDILKVVQLMSPTEAQTKGFEGVVAVPQDSSGVDLSVNSGVKIKWWMDPHDWRIDKIAFEKGPRGGVAGVVHCTSLESGKSFKLGPGQMGDHILCRHMAENPEEYEGRTLKVLSRHGHEGRASKVQGFHDDK